MGEAHGFGYGRYTAEVVERQSMCSSAKNNAKSTRSDWQDVTARDRVALETVEARPQRRIAQD